MIKNNMNRLVPYFRGIDKYILAKNMYVDWINQFTHRDDPENNDMKERMDRHDKWECPNTGFNHKSVDKYSYLFSGDVEKNHHKVYDNVTTKNKKR